MTATDFTDEVALPDFEDALWAALRAEAAAAECDPTASSRPIRLDATPAARARRGALTAAAVLVVAVVAGGALVARRGDDRGSTVVGATASTETQTTGVEVEVPPDQDELAPRPGPDDLEPPPPPATSEAIAVAAALREASATTIQVSETTTYGVVTGRTWGDDVSGAGRALSLRSDGSPKFDLGAAEAPPADGGALVDPPVRAVDHCFGEWSSGPGPIIGGHLLTVADQLATGQLLVDGPVAVDGRTLIATHSLTFVERTDPETGALLARGWEDLPLSEGPYLDPESMLPVVHVSPLQQRPGVDDGPGESRTTYTYLDRSEAAARATLVAPVPAGFTRVDQVRTDDERTAALCW